MTLRVVSADGTKRVTDMDYISRTGWGARPPKRGWTTLHPRSVKGIVVHHTAGGAGIAGLHAAEAHHMDVRGWNAIAYNWLIDHHGTIYEGRGWDAVGGATGWLVDRKTVSVCYIGFGSQTLPEAAQRAFLTVVGEAKARFGDGFVRTHRRYKATECPGSFLGDWVEGGMDVAHSPHGVDWDGIGRYIEDLRIQVTGRPLSRWRRSRGEAVRETQKALKRRGFDPGPADGIFGRRTQSAVKAFQRSVGFLKVDGVVGGNTFAALFIM